MTGPTIEEREHEHVGIEPSCILNDRKDVLESHGISRLQKMRLLHSEFFLQKLLNTARRQEGTDELEQTDKKTDIFHVG